MSHIVDYFFGEIEDDVAREHEYDYYDEELEGEEDPAVGSDDAVAENDTDDVTAAAASDINQLSLADLIEKNKNEKLRAQQKEKEKAQAKNRKRKQQKQEKNAAVKLQDFGSATIREEMEARKRLEAERNNRSRRQQFQPGKLIQVSFTGCVKQCFQMSWQQVDIDISSNSSIDANNGAATAAAQAASPLSEEDAEPVVMDPQEFGYDGDDIDDDDDDDGVDDVIEGDADDAPGIAQPASHQPTEPTETRGQTEQRLAKIMERGLRGFAMSIYQGKVIVGGGIDKNGKHLRSILQFDPQTFGWSILADHCPLTTPGMFIDQSQNKILAFDGMYFSLYDPNPEPAAPGRKPKPPSWQNYRVYVEPEVDKYTWRKNYFEVSKDLAKFASQRLSYFSCVHTDASWYFFGGVSAENGKVVDSFFKVLPKVLIDYTGNKRAQQIQFQGTDLLDKRSAPEARYKHASCIIKLNRTQKTKLSYQTITAEVSEQHIVIFGGIGHDQKLLNDLWVYSTINNRWHAANVIGASPPPMHSFSMFSTSRYIYVYGGYIKAPDGITDIPSNALYRFELEDSGSAIRGKWVQVSVRGAASPFSELPDDYQYPLAGHRTVLLDSKTAFSFGEHGETKALTCSVLHGIEDEGEAPLLPAFLWKCVEKGDEADVALRTVTIDTDSSGKEIRSYDYIRCHRCVLSVRSRRFSDLLINLEQVAPYDKNTATDVPVLEMPDHYQTDVVRAYVKFLYTATVEIQYSHNIKALVEMAREFGHAELIEDLCSGQVALYIDSNGLALSQLQKDFLKLLNQSHEHVYGYFTDTVLMHAQRQDEEQSMGMMGEEWSRETHAHRVFLNRSTFLRRCFRAGMEEAQFGRIRFDEIGPGALQIVLRYMYGDTISFRLDQCAEVYIASKLLELTRLTEFCRSLLFDFMDIDNVLDLLSVAEMYADQVFLERCYGFIGSQQLVLNAVLADPRYADMSEQSRRQIEIKRLEGEKRQIADRRWMQRKQAQHLRVQNIKLAKQRKRQ